MANYNPPSKAAEVEGEGIATFSRRKLLHIVPERNCYRIFSIEVNAGLFHYVLTRAWGRIGYKVRIKEEFFLTAEEAFLEASRIYRRKVKKGYEEVKSYADYLPEAKLVMRRSRSVKKRTDAEAEGPLLC